MAEVKIRNLFKSYGNTEVIHGLDVDIGDGTDNLQRVGFYYANHGTAANRPHLDLTTEAAAAGYGNDVIGVTSTSISKVIGVATADIEKVIGVD